MKPRDALLLIAGVIVLGLSLMLGPFGAPGDAAGILMIGAAGTKLLDRSSHGK